MPQIVAKDNTRLNTEAALMSALADFLCYPGAQQWNRMLVAMLAQQQAHFNGDPDLIRNHAGMSARECDEFVETEINPLIRC